MTSDGVESAEEHGLVLFLNLNGASRPGDLEDAFLGEPELYDKIAHPLESWFLSRYPDALTTLIRRGVVKFWRDEAGTVWYDLTTPAG